MLKEARMAVSSKEKPHMFLVNKAQKPKSGKAAVPGMLRRLLPVLSFMLGLVVLVVAFYDDGYGALPPSEKRYAAARAAVESLKDDPKRNIYRDQWLKLADEFFDIYQRDSRWANRPAALYRSAEVLEELGARSFAARDYKAALERYEMLVKEHSASRLADDALLRAAIIRAKHLDDKTGALRSLRQIRTHYPRADMAGDAAELEKALLAENSAPATTAKSAASKPEAETRKESAKASTTPRVLESAQLTQVSWASLSKDKVQITVELNRHAPWQVRMQESGKKGEGPRLVLEVNDAVPVEQVRGGARIKGSLLTRVLVSEGKNNSTALAFDFSAARRYDTRVEQNPFRIVLTVLGGAGAPPRNGGGRLGFAENVLPQPEAEHISARRVEALRAKAAQSRAVAEAGVLPAPDQAVRRVAATGKAAGHMAEQLGLTVQTVFIDAGHGGKDPGTLHNDIMERDLVLDIARRVGRLLSANGLEVIYSRQGDQSVPLSARPQKANAARADLFVSIHVNANNDASVSGFETFYLDIARNAQAARTATLENAASDRKLGDMQSVLADVMLNARTEESGRLAGDIQRTALARLSRRGFEVKDGGTKAAPFHVLIGAGMPAVLVEVGYCTNTREAKLLGSPGYRHALAEGIAEGIMAYKNRLQVRHAAQLPAQMSLTRKSGGAI